MKKAILPFLNILVNIIGKERTRSLILTLAKFADINLAPLAFDQLRRLNNQGDPIPREQFVAEFAKLAGIDLLPLALNQMGILKYQNSYVSGEKYVMEKVLKQWLGKTSLTVFDVGANSGNYSLELREALPDALIFAFEPNPITFELLKSNLRHPNDKCFCLGFGDIAENRIIYTYSNEPACEQASLYKTVITDFHERQSLEINIELATVDKFCQEYNIETVDFLKIDTEGNELNVLKGAKQMLDEHRIAIIQFEFNHMNVISRVFLKDFFDILSDYNIYRLDTDRLIPLPVYHSTHEIFRFQNLLAISKKLKHE
jgi:FkbM family methyltransferase